MFAKFSVVEKNGDAEGARLLQKADSHIPALEREEGARAIYSMHIPRTQSSICSHGVRSTGHCGIVECVGELHDRKALY